MNEGFEFTLHASSSPAFDRFFAGLSFLPVADSGPATRGVGRRQLGGRRLGLGGGG